jgi:hypothetical protein
VLQLILFLFVLQGNNPTEWSDSCFYDFDNTIYHEITPDVYFCKVILELNLNRDDIEKLGKELNWNNYAKLTVDDFIDKWKFYQDYGVKETLEINTFVSGTDILPPIMKSEISFNYKSSEKIKKFNKSFTISPLYKNRICNDDIENHRCFNEEIDPYSFDESLQMAYDKIGENPASGSGTPIFDLSEFQVISIIIGILIGIGSFLGLMIFWKLKKVY